MNDADAAGFFAEPGTLDPDAYLWLDYQLECRGDPRIAAAHFASEQSTAQWRRVNSPEDLRVRFGAKVVEFEIVATRSDFSLPVQTSLQGPVSVCRLRIAHPHTNFGPRIPNLLSAVCGEGIYFSPGAPLVKLLDIGFPDAFLRHFEGPRFGVKGLRKALNVYDRPIFFGVIKPNIGLNAQDMAELAEQGWLGGLDIAKDDEMLGDTEWCSLRERLIALGEARRRAEARTGVPKIYLANITDEVEVLGDHHDLAVAHGAGALLLNALPVGFSAVRMLARRTRLPLVAHFPMLAALSRPVSFGISSLVLTKLQRLAGFDVIIMPGFGDRMFSSDQEVRQNAEACLQPMGGLRASLPVPGGSDWAGTLQGVYERLGTLDFGFVPGRGVFGHPMGPQAGAASLRQAWDAIRSGVPIGEYAARHPELRAALDAFAPQPG